MFRYHVAAKCIRLFAAKLTGSLCDLIGMVHSCLDLIQPYEKFLQCLVVSLHSMKVLRPDGPRGHRVRHRSLGRNRNEEIEFYTQRVNKVFSHSTGHNAELRLSIRWKAGCFGFFTLPCPRRPPGRSVRSTIGKHSTLRLYAYDSLDTRYEASRGRLAPGTRRKVGSLGMVLALRSTAQGQ